MQTGQDQQSYARFRARERAMMRKTFVGFAVIAAIAAGTAVAVAAVSGDRDETSPAATVRAFLITALDSDGFYACRYLTHRGRVSVDHAVEEPHTPCEVAIPFMRLTLGHESVDREADVKRLSDRTERHGRSVSVTVAAEGASHTFRLIKASLGELDEFGAPPTPWRIDSGVAELVRR
jgi:hypothetical protein